MKFKTFIVWLIMVLIWLAAIVLLTGCSIPDIPNIPTGAICMPNNFYMQFPSVDLGDETLNTVVEPVTHIMDYVFDDTGAAMTCEFTYYE